MIRLSMSVISSATKLLRFLDDKIVRTVGEVRTLYKIGDIDVDDLTEMLQKCELITDENENCWGITGSGNYVLEEIKKCNYENAYRIILEKYIILVAPLWSKRIPSGRNEAIIFMTKDEKACFYEASLINDNPTDDEIIWWDHISELMRKVSDENKVKIGRTGEKLTLLYEEKRTGVRPKWMAIDSNLLGYDIKSVCSNNGEQIPLFIEVKTSTAGINEAFCHISSHEWEVSRSAPAYMFYFWSIRGALYRIATLSKNDLEPHIPYNNNDGTWESVKIPFRVFEEKFVEWSAD